MTTRVEKYNYVTRILHWVVALLISFLFGFGWWMTDLDYYSSWYQTAPQLHVLIGLALVMLMMIRIGARFIKAAPTPLSQLSSIEVVVAHVTHLTLYLMILVIMLSGYLIVASGDGMMLFDLFELPQIAPLLEQQEDIAGNIHYWSAWSVIVLAFVHALAALKHHFLSGDDTLRRML
jgi:cytochrome b561